jgi:nitrogen fixation protein NifQ
MKISLLNTDEKVSREAHHSYLMTFARGQGNDDALACMFASWMAGESALPVNWGLSLLGFEALGNLHFPGCKDFLACASPDVGGQENRMSEQAELIALMRSHRAGESPSELWMASIVYGSVILT